MQWQPIETAPKDGRPFLALNHDREVWVAKWLPEPSPRLVFRTNQLRVSTSHDVVRLDDGREALVEDKSKHRETWESNWTIWTRGYEFKPTHWTRLDPPT